ncbi:MAG: chloride channel protein [Zavarzinia sp.]|nr:chloride channel protein [Zavarzinia sp.]
MRSRSMAYRLRRKLRPSLSLWLSSLLWRRRLVFWLGAILTGLVCVGFAYAVDFAFELFGLLTGVWPWAGLVVTPLGFGLCTLLLIRFFPGGEGSGIPQAIAARKLESPTQRNRLLSLRIAFGKVMLTTLALGFGASVGREGPSVQVGASIMLACSRFAGLGRMRGVILAGSAAGVAAAFNTPLAGIIFAIEEMSRAYERRVSTLILSAVLLAAGAAALIHGSGSYFGQTMAQLDDWTDWLAVPLLGVGGGVIGACFARLMIAQARYLPRLINGRIGRHRVIFAMFCGLVVALVAWATALPVNGTGYAEAKAALNGTLTDPWAFVGAKLLANLVTQASGLAGGIFAPTLAVGAGLGAAIGDILPGVSPGALAALGMVALFAGVMQAPITGFVIVFEMTDNHAMVIPLMAVAIVAAGTSRMICHQPIYHALSELFLAKVRAAGQTGAPGGLKPP